MHILQCALTHYILCIVLLMLLTIGNFRYSLWCCSTHLLRPPPCLLPLILTPSSLANSWTVVTPFSTWLARSTGSSPRFDVPSSPRWPCCTSSTIKAVIDLFIRAMNAAQIWRYDGIAGSVR